MNDWLEAYLRQLRAWNYSPETIKSQQGRLKRLLECLLTKGIKTPLKAQREHLASYQIWLCEQINAKGARNQPQTLNLSLAATKRFFGWLHDEGEIPVNPAKSLRYAKTPKLLPKSILNTTEVRVFIGGCDTETLLGYRDRCIVEILYGSGIRQGELRRLKLEDMDWQARTLMVRRGKGNKDRVVPLTKISLRYLRHYVDRIRPKILNGREDLGFVFVSAKAANVSKPGLMAMIAKVRKASGLAKRVHAHALRAACITHMLRNQNNAGRNVLPAVMELSGHSNLQSLHHYTGTDIHELQEIHAKTHPRELEA